MFIERERNRDFEQEQFDRAADKWHDDRAEREGLHSSTHNSQLPMGMLKNYLLRLQEGISEHQFGQDAVEWAIVSGLVPLTYNFDKDIVTLVTNYDSIIDNYREARKTSAPLLELTMQFAAQAGLPATEIASDVKEAA